jgi:hypothetical protein
MGLPDGTGLFSELFRSMENEIKINKFKAKDYGDAPNMTAYEKKISFLNRYFVYKKFMEVEPEKVEIDLGEYEQTEISRDALESVHAQSVAKEQEKKLKPKVRKLSKKLLLVPATEAVDEITPPAIIEQVMKKEKAVKKEKKDKKEPLEKKEKKVKIQPIAPAAPKTLLIEDSDED